MPAGFEKTPAGKEVTGIIKQSFVDGAKRAGEVASIFVLLGAISSLFIPNTSPAPDSRGPARRVAG